VGTTTVTWPVWLALPVHPHACGDYEVLWEANAPVGGPSPRVWGLPPHAPGDRHEGRSIPTRVGTTVPEVEHLQHHRSIPTRVGTTRG